MVVSPNYVKRSQLEPDIGWPEIFFKRFEPVYPAANPVTFSEPGSG
jgi:hypothetical protein